MKKKTTTKKQKTETAPAPSGPRRSRPKPY